MQHAETLSRTDEQEFRRLVEPFRAPLVVHCYSMLGSLHDAEDAVQEVLLRAWNGLGRFEGRASVRTWLYRIATNACLDEIERRPRRAAIVDPFPDAWLDQIDDPIADPAARYAVGEGIELALLAAIQLLPGRQRAVLILRDVLGWRSAEVAALLDTSVVAVNSALQRARETIEAHAPAPGRLPVSASRSRVLLRSCVDAWNRADVEQLVGLLQGDAVMRMPPQPSVSGAAAIGRFLERLPGGGSFRQMRATASSANGRPALVLHRLVDGELEPHGVLVLEPGERRVAAIDVSISSRLVSSFTSPLSERTPAA
jgi:RNA polymerase sigma-70 factor (ECF subfamily)